MQKPKKIILDKEQHSKAGRIILWIYFTAFLVLGIHDLIILKLTAADNFTAVIFLGLFLLASMKFKISPITAVFLGLVFFPNTIGHMGGYGVPLFDYQFDKIVHVFTAFFSTVAIILFMRNNSKIRFINIAGIAFFVTITFGAAVEMSEYWAFIFIGFGEGYLGFGIGDNSKNFGPWEDSSLDTTFNFLGSLIGVLSSYIFILLRKLNPSRTT